MQCPLYFTNTDHTISTIIVNDMLSHMHFLKLKLDRLRRICHIWAAVQLHFAAASTRTTVHIDNTWSGHSYKVMDKALQQQWEVSEASLLNTTQETANYQIDAGEVRRLREAEIMEDHRQQECDNEECIRGTSKQVEMVQWLVEDKPT